jgi:uncharacterized protein (TIGR00290 family)
MKAFLNWSGGKDSALCLYTAQENGIPVEALVTAISRTTQRVSMHGVRRELIEAQAKAIGLPVYFIELEEGGGMSAYENSIHASNQRLKAEGFTDVLSGDLFLEDLKIYREGLYGKDHLSAQFPLWLQPCDSLIATFLNKGFKAITIAVEGSKLGEDDCGREMNAGFFKGLPEGVDPCGENGEYHSFVWDGPIFSRPVLFEKGGLHSRTYPAPKSKDDCFKDPLPPALFYFCDLLPGKMKA